VEKLQEYGNEKRKKIVEFMLELRKLFALMVGTQRKYVDPTRAVDILRGSIGTQDNQNRDILSLETNNQQDVSEFTHKVLEWVEEAFKEDSGGGQGANGKSESEIMQMDADCEKENNEEKVVPADEGQQDPAEGTNQMSRLFYGKFLTEGRIHGDDFVRQEAFGQWPLQVNINTNNIHESLENSLAHESLEAANTTCSSSAGDAQQKSGQERWFLRLPPVLFLTLSRFHYNKERKTAEKIHNRVDFPERIFMDRYVADNKVVIRQKREEVRALKERRALLKARLDKFTHYGSEDPSSSSMALPQILQRTLDFAKSIPVPPTVASLAVSNLMQVDSPCSSPKMTPASSLSNLAAAAAVAAAASAADGSNQFSNECDEAMDVEMTPTEPDQGESAGCDERASTAERARGDLDDPHPRLVTEVELRILQVRFIE
jgi:ubiquitin carboxyl-terminal hydrolase 25/28